MTQSITIIMDSVRKSRNAKEWRDIARATWAEGGLVEIHDGDASIRLLKRIYENGHDPDAIVTMWRGENPASKPCSLNSWVNPPDRRPEALKRCAGARVEK